MVHVILCGGAGTRLWPLSNQSRPKQLLQLFNDKSLLQWAALRNAPFCESLLAICSAKQEEDVRMQLSTADSTTNLRLLAEPVGRNTAAAIALAALIYPPESVLLVTPADHLIGSPERYKKAIEKAQELAEAGNLVTFGLKPLYAETGYGYIQHKDNEVIRFAEKPDQKTAKSFLDAGDYLWNSGIFCFKAETVLTELEKYAPEILEKAKIAAQEWLRTGTIRLETMKAIPSNSIDYAIMEHSQKVKVVPTNIDWSDVGSYEALAEALLKFNEKSHRPTHTIGAENNSVTIGHHKPVFVVGAENLIVVDTPSALLILQKGKGQDIKGLHLWVQENELNIL